MDVKYHTLAVYLYDPQTEDGSIADFQTDVDARVARKVYDAIVKNSIPEEERHFTKELEE